MSDVPNEQLLEEQLGEACGEVVVLRRTVEWILNKSSDIDVVKDVCRGALNMLGYPEHIGDYELAPILGEVAHA